jgi:hypothetical protein
MAEATVSAIARQQAGIALHLCFMFRDLFDLHDRTSHHGDDFAGERPVISHVVHGPVISLTFEKPPPGGRAPSWSAPESSFS